MQTGLPSFNASIINTLFGETAPLSVNSTSSYVTFGLASSARCTDVMVTNAGSHTAFIAFGVAANGVVSAAVPTSGGGISGGVICVPILSGAIYTFQKNTAGQLIDTCAAICGGSDSTTLYFTAVQGS